MAGADGGRGRSPGLDRPAGLGRTVAGRRWLLATISLTVLPLAAAVLLAPPAGSSAGPALSWLLFVGSSMHIGATGWFYTLPEVRGFMGRHRSRYVLAPAALILGTAALAAALSEHQLTRLLLIFFGWQFFHFQKQNLGMAALAAAATEGAGLTRAERRALTGTGLAGIGGLIAHPGLLQLTGLPALDLLFSACGVAYVAGVIAGLWSLSRRQPADRPSGFVLVYLISLVFFAPVFLFGSPYAAVAGLTLAHGYQYLLIVGMTAGARVPGRANGIAMLVLLNLSLVIGLLLNQFAHLHAGGPVARAGYGLYLGVVMSHFVIDAGLWRLRDEFPRAFLGQRLPYLLRPTRNDVPSTLTSSPG